MLQEEEYEALKNSFIESQRLFDKLNRVAKQYNEIEYDESGFSLEEEETLERHWLKLSSKIVDALAEQLQDFNIELKKNETLAVQKLQLKLTKEEDQSNIDVDYSEDGAISISQIS